MIKIISLNQDFLTKACALAESIFPWEEISPTDSFCCSLDLNKYSEFIKEHNVKDLEYYIAIDEKDNVVWTSGLYSLNSETAQSLRLGRYCVDPNYRGQWIGTKLLDYSIQQAKNKWKTVLNLYTSTNPKEAIAQKIYEKYNFHITDQPREKQWNYEIFYRKKIL